MSSNSEYWPKELEAIGRASTEVESLVKRVKHIKQEIINFDRTRQENVESLRHIRNLKKDPDYCSSDKISVSLNGSFLEIKSGVYEEYLLKQQEELSTTIEEMRVEQKQMVTRLIAIAPQDQIDPHSLKLLLTN